VGRCHIHTGLNTNQTPGNKEIKKPMKKKILLLTGISSLLLMGSLALASDDPKEITITGEAKCAKCMLKEADKCQTVIQVEENGSTVSYWVAKNSVGNDFHDQVCKASKKVTATGTVKDAGGKKEFTATKIEAAK
jgi:hypothetical protein